MIIEVVIGVIGGGMVLSTMYSFAKFVREERKKPPQTLDDKIRRLLHSSEETLYLVSEVESDIKKRQKIVQELKSDSERLEQLASMHREQADAVAALLQGQIRRESNRSLLQGAIVNFVFFLMGAALSWYLGR